MKQGRNNLTVEGFILEKKIVAEGTGKSGKWMKAEFIIRDLAGAEIPVGMFQNEMKTDWETKEQVANGGYKGLLTIMKEYKTIAKDGDDADFVSITKGNLSKNVYRGSQDGQLRENVGFDTRYIKRTEKTNDSLERAELVVSGVIRAKTLVNDDTQMKVELIVPNYKGETELFKFDVVTKDAVEFFETSEEVEIGKSVELDIEINYVTEVIEKEVHRSFGGTKVEKTTKYVKRLEIVGVSEILEESAWDIDEIKEAEKERKLKIEAIMNAPAKKKDTATSTGNKTSFNKDKIVIKDSDIPF